MTDLSFKQVAVLVPCYNEEATIATVINDFHPSLPGPTVYVFDNNSSDNAIEVARKAGATVRQQAQYIPRRSTHSVDDFFTLQI
ncbi:MAG: putative glycosyl transferase [Nitrosospira multiformis]|jgi:glycosyltransferase involved in cell wall biosynthesis|nr:putative glycosyl transferase [Nitrosospira multiformis]